MLRIRRGPRRPRGFAPGSHAIVLPIVTKCIDPVKHAGGKPAGHVKADGQAWEERS